MKNIETEKIHNTGLFFMLIAPFTIAYYSFYIFNPIHAGNFWLYVLQLIADSIAIINIGALWLTILLDLIQPEYYKRDIKYNKKWIKENSPSVDILIPIYKEPLHIIKETIKNAVLIDYPHKVYALDDGDSQDVKTLAQSLDVNYIARPRYARKYAKSGNLNYGLKSCKGEFFAIFDADHVPKKNFLTELLPFFENEKVALVQTPQHYGNTYNYIASGTAQAQEIFYKYIQPAKNSYNSSFCVGTNVLFRRSAIDEIGGMALTDHSEDIWTTILLHEKKYETIFYNKILAEGRAPETIPAFFKQQTRWARGGFSLFFTHNPLFIDNFTTDQKLQYFFSNIHYFTAFSILVYLMIPIIFLLYGIHPMDVLNNKDWAIHYIPYFITFNFLPLFLLGKLKFSTISISIASFSPYLKAFLSVVLKNNYKWVATESSKNNSSLIIADIWPHIFFIALSLFSILVGWFNVKDVTTTTISTIWVLLNAYLLFAFIKNGLLGTRENLAAVKN